MKRYALICMVAAASVFAACGNKNKGSMLERKWHAVKLENAEMDSFFINSQKYIDTVGIHNTAAINMELYGVTNMDSMRKQLQLQYDSAKAMQTDAVTNTIFNFRKDKIAILSFNGALDSSKWNFNGKDTIELADPIGLSTSKVKMEVLSLSDTELKLRFRESDAISVVTFKPEGK